MFINLIPLAPRFLPTKDITAICVGLAHEPGWMGLSNANGLLVKEDGRIPWEDRVGKAEALRAHLLSAGKGASSS